MTRLAGLKDASIFVPSGASAEITGASQHAGMPGFLHGGWGSEIWPSSLHSKHLTISLAPKAF